MKTLALQAVAAWNNKDLDALRSIYAKASFFDPLLNRDISGEQIIEYAQGIYAAFPDLKFVIKEIALSENGVMIEWSQNGTNLGPVLDKSATGRYIKIPAVSVIRFEGKELVSQRDYWDMKKLWGDLFGPVHK